jgi:hypothetical protein
MRSFTTEGTASSVSLRFFACNEEEHDTSGRAEAGPYGDHKKKTVWRNGQAVALEAYSHHSRYSLIHSSVDVYWNSLGATYTWLSGLR